jgi:hypothetical protein
MLENPEPESGAEGPLHPGFRRGDDIREWQDNQRLAPVRLGLCPEGVHFLQAGLA